MQLHYFLKHSKKPSIISLVVSHEEIAHLERHIQDATSNGKYLLVYNLFTADDHLFFKAITLLTTCQYRRGLHQAFKLIIVEPSDAFLQSKSYLHRQFLRQTLLFYVHKPSSFQMSIRDMMKTELSEIELQSEEYLLNSSRQNSSRLNNPTNVLN